MEDFKVNELRIKQLILLDSLVMLKLKNVLKDGDHLLDIPESVKLKNIKTH